MQGTRQPLDERNSIPAHPMRSSKMTQSQTAVEAEHVALNILEQFSVGIVLLDRSSEVVFANTAALSLSQEVGSLCLHRGLKSRNPSHNRRLDEMIHSVLRGAPTCAMSFPALGSARPLLVLASPVRDTEQGCPSVRSLRSVAAMLLLYDADRPAQVPAAWMMDAFGLTLAEVRVALSVASGDTIPDAARRLNISPNTVKTHLRRIYEKTGTKRQAELTRFTGMMSILPAGGPQAIPR